MRKYIFLTLQLLCVQFAFSQAELLKYGDFESWITRDIKESALMGGQTKRLYEVGPEGKFDGDGHTLSGFYIKRDAMAADASELGIYDIQSEGCCYITFKAKDDAKRLDLMIKNIILRDGLETSELVFDGECPMFDKFDEYIPAELLRDAYAVDRLRRDEVFFRFTNEEMETTTR